MNIWRRREKKENRRLQNQQANQQIIDELHHRQIGQPQIERAGQPQSGQECLDNSDGETPVFERDGLFNLIGDTLSAKEYKIDIVAVHGLGGHWEKTWTAENTKFWLRDFLPSQLPTARIMSYGYNSDTAFSKAVTDIDDAAIMLLDRLDGERQLPEEIKRPIVFISHSLGGIIVKKALILAHERSRIYSDLLESVQGSVFFAVPHRGSDTAYWGSFAANILRFSTLGRTNTNFVTALQKNSSTFADISQQFIERGMNLQIRTFYETMTYYNQLIVDKDSACLGLPNERAVGIAGANHRDICKFNDAKSQKYLQVGNAVKQLVNSVIAVSSPMPPSKEEIECLCSLYTSDYESHKARNPGRVPGTLEWFLVHEKYERWWQEEKSSLLWVSADPGYGKSVLASFLVDKFNSPASQSIQPSTVCYFFYKDGYEDQNNAVSALCALLHQLLKAKTSLIKYAMDEEKDKGQRFKGEWRSLWGVFRRATMDPGCGKVICVIDGLDECEKSTRYDFIDCLVNIYKSAGNTRCDADKMSLKFIVTSRPYISIETKFQSLPSIRLKAENETPAISADIELVVEAEVKKLGEMWNLPDKARSNLYNKLLGGADRTFLWVSLILGLLKDTVGASEAEFGRILNNLPTDLDETYERILGNSIDPTKAKTILHIVVAAVRPLTLDEMDIALAIRPSHKSVKDLESYRIYSIESAVKNLCGLFVRVIDSKIYLVHQTAKEFLVKDSATSHSTTGWKHSLIPAQSNFTLANICIRYLLFTVFEAQPLVVDDKAEVDRYTQQHNFLDYAANHWSVHFQGLEIKAEQELMNLALEICDTGSRRLLTWFRVYCRVSLDKPCPKDLTDLIVMSYFGHEAAVGLLLERVTNINTRGGLYGSALNDAAFQKHHGVVKILLDKGADVYLFGGEFSDLSQKTLERFTDWFFRFGRFEEFFRFFEREFFREERREEEKIFEELKKHCLDYKDKNDHEDEDF